MFRDCIEWRSQNPADDMMTMLLKDRSRERALIGRALDSGRALPRDTRG
jgi:hypothetical protein